MSMKLALVGALLSAGLASVSAQAAVTLVGTNTSLTGNALGTTIVEDFSSYADGTGNFTDGAGLTFSGSGGVERTTTGIYAEPAGDTTAYFTTTASGGNGTEWVAMPQVESKFGLYWGSMDAYNTLVFYLGATVVGTFTGSQVALFPPGANGDQGSSATNRYVNFYGLYDKVEFMTGQPAFEIDNISTGVPEVSTWAMLLLGFAGLGLAGYRGTKRNAAAFAG